MGSTLAGVFVENICIDALSAFTGVYIYSSLLVAEIGFNSLDLPFRFCLCCPLQHA